MMVGVAHLARAPGCGPGGGGFDPLRSPHKKIRGFRLGFFYGLSEGGVFNSPRFARAKPWIDRSPASVSKCKPLAACRGGNPLLLQGVLLFSHIYA